MNWVDVAPFIVGGGGLGAAILGAYLRKYFVKWNDEHVIMQNTNSTLDCKSCDPELAYTKLSLENSLLKNQIEKLEAKINQSE